MQILQINKFYYSKGGPEFYVRKLEAVFQKHGHKTMIFSMKDERNWTSPYSKYFISNLDFSGNGKLLNKAKIPLRMFYSFEAKRKLEALIKYERPDIAHLHNIYHQISPSVISVLKKARIPIVITLHDYKLLCPNYYFFNGKRTCEACKGKKFYNAVFNKCIKGSVYKSLLCAMEAYLHLFTHIYANVDAFIFLSQFMMHKHKEFGYYDDSKFHYHTTPVDDIGRELNGDCRGDYALYIGGVEKHKGVFTLIQAAEVVPQVRVKIVGSGVLFGEIENYIHSHGIENVDVLGYVSDRGKIEELISSCFCMVLPSICYENTATIIPEAFSLGKPVVASRLGSMPELVRERETGLLFEPGNPVDLAKKLLILHDQPELAAHLGAQGKEICRDLCSIEAHYEKLVNIYDALIKRAENFS